MANAICPSCLAKYEADVTSCPKDGTALVPAETFAAVDRDLAAGDIVGEYRIEAKIGVGGFGAVYRAVHPVIGKTAAVKVLGRQFSANAAMVSRFIAEARAVNQIRHRNIIDIFAFGALPDGRQYYIMELLDGTPFDRYLDEHKRLSVPQAVPILRGIARALDAAHAKGILHRDLKPENVYLVFDEDGRVEPKLLDFGLVKLMTETSGGHLTKTGTPMGTPYYMSPEQCRGLEVDRRTDVYAFGAMIFQVLTGEVPFSGSSSMDVLVKHMTAEPPDASARCLDVSPNVDPILKRMMAKEPDYRPGSLGEALELLLEAAQFERPVDSVKLPAPGASGPQLSVVAGSHRRLETVPTVIDDGSAHPGSAQVRVAPGQTLLGSESDVLDPIVPAKRRRVVPFAAAAALAVVAALAIGVSMQNTPKRTASASVVQTAAAPTTAKESRPIEPKPAVSATPGEEELRIRVDGAPAGAVVSVDGKEVGTAPGPFAMKKGVETKITVSAKGYKTKELALTPAPDSVVNGSLERAAAPAVKTKKPGLHSDLEGFDSK